MDGCLALGLVNESGFFLKCKMKAEDEYGIDP